MKHTIAGTKTEPVTITVDSDSLLREVEQVLLRNVGMYPGQWIENGQICIEQYTSHSWSDRIRPANEEQIKAWDTLTYLRKQFCLAEGK